MTTVSIYGGLSLPCLFLPLSQEAPAEVSGSEQVRAFDECCPSSTSPPPFLLPKDGGWSALPRLAALGHPGPTETVFSAVPTYSYFLLSDPALWLFTCDRFSHFFTCM